MRLRGVLLALLLCSRAAVAGGDWPHFGGGQHGKQYSPLTRITVDNVAEPEEASRSRTGEPAKGFRAEFAFRANPIVAEGRLYFSDR